MKIFILVVGLLELLVGSVLLINPRLMAAYKKANNALLTTVGDFALLGNLANSSIIKFIPLW